MDPQLFFRRVFQVIYAILLLGFVGSVAFSATYEAFFVDTPSAEVEGSGPLDDAACVTRIGAYFADLDRRAQAAMSRIHEPAVDTEWRAFSRQLRGQLSTLRQRCRLDDPDKVSVLALATALERQRHGYDTVIRGLVGLAREPRGLLVERYGISEPTNP